VAKKKNTIAKIDFDVVSFFEAGHSHSLCDDQSKDLLNLLAGRAATGLPLLAMQETAALPRWLFCSLNKWRFMAHASSGPDRAFAIALWTLPHTTPLLLAVDQSCKQDRAPMTNSGSSDRNSNEQ
jgi:hypothetical protein